MIELNFDGDRLVGLEPVNPTTCLYLGAATLDRDNVTAAIREFNLPNAVAPGEWPAPHERVRPALEVLPLTHGSLIGDVEAFRNRWED